MRKIVKKYLVYLAILTVLTLLTPSVNAALQKNELTPITVNQTKTIKKWSTTMVDDDRLFKNLADYANDDEELKEVIDSGTGQTVYDFLRSFFRDCGLSRLDFFFRIHPKILDATSLRGHDLDMKIYDLSEIVKVVKNKERPRLWCHQQAIFLAAGIKASFSSYDENENVFIPHPDYDFKISFFRSYDYSHFPILPYKSHVQIVLKSWPTEDEYNPYGWEEMDTWDDVYVRPGLGKDATEENSILSTKDVSISDNYENIDSIQTESVEISAPLESTSQLLSEQSSVDYRTTKSSIII